MLGTIYNALAAKRRVLFVATAAVLIVSALAATRVTVREDIETMLPDTESRLAADFQILKRAPFARKVIVHLQKDENTSLQVLVTAADQLAAQMTAPHFTRVVTGPGELAQLDLLNWLLDTMPALSTDDDMRELAKRAETEEVRKGLTLAFRMLNTPESIAAAKRVAADPLDYLAIAMAKLRNVNLVPHAQVQQGHFVDRQGNSLMLFADTSIPITDTEDSKRLLEHFDELARRHLPEGITATLICAHRYTVANASTIKRDLLVILPVASLAILLIFCFFLGNWRAVFVFLTSFAVLPIAILGVAFLQGSVSGITIGFGAVLLGIAVDFALHVYFALRHGEQAPDKSISRVSRPIALSGLTTIGAFVVLMFSALPVQRQLAVFSIVGLLASLFLSLVVLPHLIAPASPSRHGLPQKGAHTQHPRVLLIVWSALIVVCLALGANVQFSGSLRELGVVPEQLRADESHLAQTWGSVRGMALLVVEEDDLQTALAANDALFAVLSDQYAPGEAISIAPVLPALQTQETNRCRWRQFWNADRLRGLQTTLSREGKALGFSENAFRPFLQRLEQPGPEVTPDRLRALGLADMLEAFVAEADGNVRITTMLPDDPEALSLLKSRLPTGVQLVAQSHFQAAIARTIEADFRRFLIMATLMVLAVLLVLFRSPKKLLLAITPPASGFIVMLGVMALIGRELNLFNIIAGILVLGLGVDYGIFMVCRVSEGLDHATERAVLVSGLTTLAGFGTLMLAKHPALNSIGMTVSLGVGVALVVALKVIPALVMITNRRTE